MLLLERYHDGTRPDFLLAYYGLFVHFRTKKCIKFPTEDYHHVSKQKRLYIYSLLFRDAKLNSPCFL